MDSDNFDITPEEPALSLLERLDRIIIALPPGDGMREELLALRGDVAEQEDMVSEAREALEKYEAIVKKLSSPANRIGTFLGAGRSGTPWRCAGSAARRQRTG